VCNSERFRATLAATAVAAVIVAAVAVSTVAVAVAAVAVAAVAVAAVAVAVAVSAAAAVGSAHARRTLTARLPRCAERVGIHSALLRASIPRAWNIRSCIL
jgi:hypothetical protein